MTFVSAVSVDTIYGCHVVLSRQHALYVGFLSWAGSHDAFDTSGNGEVTVPAVAESQSLFRFELAKIPAASFGHPRISKWNSEHNTIPSQSFAVARSIFDFL